MLLRHFEDAAPATRRLRTGSVGGGWRRLFDSRRIGGGGRGSTRQRESQRDERSVFTASREPPRGLLAPWSLHTGRDAPPGHARGKPRPARPLAKVHVGFLTEPAGDYGRIMDNRPGRMAKLLLERCESGRIGLTANAIQGPDLDGARRYKAR